MKKFFFAIFVLLCTVSAFTAFAEGEEGADTNTFTQFQFDNVNIICQAGTVAYPKTFDELTVALKVYPRPTNVIIDVDADGNACTLGKPFDDVYKMIKGKMVPVVSVNDEGSAEFVKKYVKENKIYDVMFCSKKPELVRELRKANKKACGVIDFTDATDMSRENLNKMVYAANENMAKTIIISDDVATKDIVEYIQKRVITVWVSENSVTKAKYHKPIQTGANGIVTEHPEILNEAYGFYSKDDNLLVRKPLVIGHRGLPYKVTENTLESAKAAVDGGADIVELDVRLTKDGEIIIYHEEQLESITTGSGVTTDYTLEELKKLTVTKSVHYGPFEKYKDLKIPTLKEYFDEFKKNDNVFFFVELKANSKELTTATCKLIEEYGLKDRVAILSFYANLMPIAEEALPGVSCGVFTGDVATGGYQNGTKTVLAAVGPDNLTYHASNVLNKDVVKSLMYHGITTWPWTYNEGNTMAAYFKGFGGVTTDSADVVKNLPIKIDVGTELSYRVAPGSTIKFKPKVKTRVGVYKEIKPELVLVDGADYVEISGNKIKTKAEGTAYAMYKLKAVKATGNPSDSYEYTIYSELIEITVDNNAPKKGCGGSISLILPAMISGGALIIRKRKNEF